MWNNVHESLRGFREDLLNVPRSNESDWRDHFDGQLNAGDDVVDDILGIAAAVTFLYQFLKELQGQELHFWKRRKCHIQVSKDLNILVMYIQVVKITNADILVVTQLLADFENTGCDVFASMFVARN